MQRMAIGGLPDVLQSTRHQKPREQAIEATMIIGMGIMSGRMAKARRPDITNRRWRATVLWTGSKAVDQHGEVEPVARRESERARAVDLDLANAHPYAAFAGTPISRRRKASGGASFFRMRSTISAIILHRLIGLR